MSDAVFGVKSSLIVVSFSRSFSEFFFSFLFLASCLRYIKEPEVVNDLSLSKTRGFKEAKPHVYLKQDFVLATANECADARRKASPNKL